MTTRDPGDEITTEPAEPIDWHPNVLEARKVLAAAKAAYQQACQSIHGQYLKSLDALGPETAAQAEAVRAEF